MNCVVHRETNAATVTASAEGRTVEDISVIDTIITCPAPPLEPVTPGPPPGGSTLDEVLAPLGPTPPAAGVSGAAALSPLRSCLRRGSIVTIRGEHIDRVTVSVAGRRVSGLVVRPLRHQARILLRRNYPPGRYRVRVAIRFERGAATAPLVLTRRVTVCARPRFTG